MNPIWNPALSTNLRDLSGSGFLDRLLPGLIGIGFVIGAVIFVFMLLYGGVQWISSGGDKVAYESAKTRITSALVGLLILFSLFAIINLIEIFFGVNILHFDLSNFSLVPSSFQAPNQPGPPAPTSIPVPTGGVSGPSPTSALPVPPTPVLPTVTPSRGMPTLAPTPTSALPVPPTPVLPTVTPPRGMF